MIRYVIAAVIIVLGALVGRADGSDPYTYAVSRTFYGQLLQHPYDTTMGVLVSPPAIWNVSKAQISLVRNGVLSPVQPVGGEISGVAFWDTSLVVLQRRDGRVFTSVYNSGLTGKFSNEIELSELGSEPDGSVFMASISAIPQSTGAYLHVGRRLYRLSLEGRELRSTFIDENVAAVHAGIDDLGWELTYLHTSGFSMFVSIIDITGRVKNTTLVPYASYSALRRVDGTIAVISDLDNSGSSVVSVIDRATRSLRTRSISVPSGQIDLASHNGNVVLVALTTRTGRPEMIVVPVLQHYEVLPKGEIISGDFGTPQRIVVQSDTAYMFFSGGMVVVQLDGSVLARDAFALGGTVQKIHARNSGQVISVVAGRTTIMLERRQQSFWFIVRGFDATLRYVVPALFLASLVFVWILNRRQRRLLDAIIDSPATGLVFTIDGGGRLLRVNERAASLLRITPNVPMRRHVRAYMQQPGLEQLCNHLDSINQSRPEPNKKISITISDEIRDYIFSTTPLVGMLGSARGVIVTGIDITETLEQRRLVNWAQLAHDMQTNLSTIRLNAEQLPAETQDSTSERRRRILFQVGVLIDRVRDLLSIGRTDELQRGPVHSAELCTEIRHEFDSDMFPHVTFSMKLRGTMMNVDRLKVSRAVRNAVENAIKALRGQEGSIEIATWHDRLHVFISVSDTGVGMDPETMANMMKPYFSTAQDGSGHGIGTMIMHHVMKLHGGAIRVTSEPGKGTQVIFRIPHEMDPKDVLRLTNVERSS